MARVTNFIYCMNSFSTEEGANAMGVLTSFSPQYIPGEFSFSVLCSIVDIEEGNHKINLIFIDPKDKILLNITGNIQFIKDDSTIPSEYSGINVCANLMNVLMEESGLYRTIVQIDEDDCGSFEIFVKGKNLRL